jgi:hypothetical protein
MARWGRPSKEGPSCATACHLHNCVSATLRRDAPDNVRHLFEGPQRRGVSEARSSFRFRVSAHWFFASAPQFCVSALYSAIPPSGSAVLPLKGETASSSSTSLPSDFPCSPLNSAGPPSGFGYLPSSSTCLPSSGESLPSRGERRRKEGQRQKIRGHCRKTRGQRPRTGGRSCRIRGRSRRIEGRTWKIRGQRSRTGGRYHRTEGQSPPMRGRSRHAI